MILSFGVCECIIVPDVSDERVSTLSHEILHGAKIAFWGSDAESGTAVVVVRVYLDALEDEFLDYEYAAL